MIASAPKAVTSVTARATIGATRILLPGDAELEAQRALLDAGTDLRADVLKVPHHGSAYSDPDFLAAVHARVGVISVGARCLDGRMAARGARPVSLDQLPELRHGRHQ